jgi:hypothetical protein
MVHRVSALTLELNEGESWDDKLPVTFTREQANIILVTLTQQISTVNEGYEDALRAAKRGDVTSMLVAPHLADTLSDLQVVLRIMAQLCDPVKYAEVMAEAVKSDEVGQGA